MVQPALYDRRESMLATTRSNQSIMSAGYAYSLSFGVRETEVPRALNLNRGSPPLVNLPSEQKTGGM